MNHNKIPLSTPSSTFTTGYKLLPNDVIMVKDMDNIYFALLKKDAHELLSSLELKYATEHGGHYFFDQDSTGILILAMNWTPAFDSFPHHWKQEQLIKSMDNCPKFFREWGKDFNLLNKTYERSIPPLTPEEKAERLIYKTPAMTPYGRPTFCNNRGDGVYEVHTVDGSAYMIHSNAAQTILSPAAIEAAWQYDVYYCYPMHTTGNIIRYELRNTKFFKDLTPVQRTRAEKYVRNKCSDYARKTGMKRQKPCERS